MYLSILIHLNTYNEVVQPFELLEILAQIYVKTPAPTFDKFIATDIIPLEDYGAET